MRDDSDKIWVYFNEVETTSTGEKRMLPQIAQVKKLTILHSNNITSFQGQVISDLRYKLSDKF